MKTQKQRIVRRKEQEDPPASAPPPRESGTPASQYVYAAALVALAFAAAAVLSFHWMYEPDLGWHLAQGREIAAGNLLKTNFFSWTYPNYRQLYLSWLFELGAFWVWKGGGAAGIQIAQAVVIGLTLIIVYLACRRRAPVSAALAVTILGVFLIEPRAVPRPHVLSFLFGAACALLVERARETRSVAPLIWTIPVVAVWSNFHAESLFGAALVGIFAFCELVRPGSLSRSQAWKAMGVAAVATLANMANPYGPGLFLYLLEGSRAPEIVQIAELRPAYLPTYAPFFAYLAAGVVLMIWKRRSLALWEVLAFAAFAFLALRHVRFVTLFMCVTAPIVAARLANVNARLVRTPALPLIALCLGLVLTPVPLSARFEMFGTGPAYIEPPTLAESGAAAFIKNAHLSGPVFNSVSLGGYLIWNTYPDVRVFQDGRFQSYPPEHFARIVSSFASQPEWDKLVAGVDWAVLNVQRNTPLTGYGRFTADTWAPVYQDRSIMIVVRRTGKYAALASAGAR